MPTSARRRIREYQNPQLLRLFLPPAKEGTSLTADRLRYREGHCRIDNQARRIHYSSSIHSRYADVATDEGWP